MHAQATRSPAHLSTPDASFKGKLRPRCFKVVVYVQEQPVHHRIHIADRSNLQKEQKKKEDDELTTDRTVASPTHPMNHVYVCLPSPNLFLNGRQPSLECFAVTSDRRPLNKKVMQMDSRD